MDCHYTTTPRHCSKLSLFSHTLSTLYLCVCLSFFPSLFLLLPLLSFRFEVQLDVLKQLGDRLDAQLQQMEADLAKIPREQAARRRATQIKLSRDYQKVELAAKNLILEARRKKAQVAEQQRQALASAVNKGDASEEERIALELQLQQESLNEEIMREREEEIRNINRGMHQVNEIYKVRSCILYTLFCVCDQVQEDELEDEFVLVVLGSGGVVLPTD